MKVVLSRDVLFDENSFWDCDWDLNKIVKVGFQETVPPIQPTKQTFF